MLNTHFDIIVPLITTVFTRAINNIAAVSYERTITDLLATLICTPSEAGVPK
jgi:hypothetical protein